MDHSAAVKDSLVLKAFLISSGERKGERARVGVPLATYLMSSRRCLGVRGADAERKRRLRARI